MILTLSASNETIGKRAYRRGLVQHQSAALNCVYAYCSAGSTESTQDLIFSGQSLIGEDGRLLAETEEPIASDYMLVCDCDLGRIRADRMKNKGFKDAAQQNHAADDGRRHGGNPCGNSQAVLHSGGHGIGLGERSGSQAAQNDSDRENDGQGFPLSAHSPLNVVHGAAIINAVLSLDTVVLAQRNLNAFRQHSQQGDDPHPEHGAGAAHHHGGGHACDVRRSYAAGQRGAHRLQRRQRSFLPFCATAFFKHLAGSIL